MSNCPECNSSETVVKDSRPAIRIGTIVTRRRRVCLQCTNRFTTYEVSDKVLKKVNIDVDNPDVFERASKIENLLKQIRNIA